MESNKSSVDVVDGTWSHLNGLIADVPCWTCRRRRLRCDNLKPSCVKCTRAGLQCLGYGPKKPLVWVEHGRRRKMAHKQTPHPASPTPAPSVKISDQEWPKTQKKQDSTHEDVQRAPEDDGRQLDRLEVGTLLKSPADPMLHQYGIKSVEYISYYEQRCCMECSIYDEKSVNPFRRFMPMALSNPLVHHTIVSLAAHHRARSEITLQSPEKHGLLFHKAILDSVEPSDTATSLQLRSRDFADALMHKQQAITHMRLALTGSTPSDAVIVSTLLLIWVELLESGYRSWKYHLGGMRALLVSRTSAALRSDVEARGAGSTLHDATFWNFGAYFEEIYVSLQTFGSTLCRDKPDLSETFTDPGLYTILRRGEFRGWTGCPAELSHILCGFNSLLCPSRAENHQENFAMRASQLFQRLEQFSCRQWAVDYPEPHYVSQRESLAHAYKCAIEIYGRRALAGQHSSELSHVAHAAVESLRCISPRDCHFKGCQWPAFVAGAEARDPSDRMAVKQILLDMHKLVRTRNVEQAIIMLERIWRQSELPNPKTWIEYVYDTGEELLLV
ncbi:Acriflavine sensitivity control protein acr-2 [Colletotrichum siamense]|uniref:Acriflavine sensitivity control protein acr-2 n=1 Tax=Colletotrichum siamense TaxID=690259 RepID=UPI001872BC3C|nr:Acriflavine sensitivity control protein acr-2 [Colletotrichum siamense]KAF5489080.1 Acriflavine sensitivity control protein acr-2 [Colletotrichum siamense]